MTSNGNKYTVVCSGSSYFFDTISFIYEARIADTPLTDGTLYRVRSASGKNSLKLGARIPFAQVPRYKTFLTWLGTGTRDIEINGDRYEGFTLVSGRISSEEDAQFAVIELTIAEVSE